MDLKQTYNLWTRYEKFLGHHLKDIELEKDALKVIFDEVNKLVELYKNETTLVVDKVKGLNVN